MRWLSARIAYIFCIDPSSAQYAADQPASLDGLLAYSILHLMPDPAAGLEHMHRLLKPGGYFVASTVCLRGSWVPYSLILAVMRRLGKAPWVGMLSKAELKALVERAGFTDVSEPDVGAESTVSFLVARKPL